MSNPTRISHSHNTTIGNHLYVSFSSNFTPYPIHAVPSTTIRISGNALCRKDIFLVSKPACDIVRWVHSTSTSSVHIKQNIGDLSPAPEGSKATTPICHRQELYSRGTQLSATIGTVLRLPAVRIHCIKHDAVHFEFFFLVTEELFISL